MLTVLAFVAPLTGTSGYISLVIGYGNGLAAPLTFLVCGAVMLLFSFGFLAMVRHVPRPGAFYTYVTAGLGKRIGLGAGVVTLMFYFMAASSGYVFGGLLSRSLVSEYLGVNLPWWLFVAVLLAIVGFCSYRGIDFNARVVGAIVTLEFALVAIFNLVTLIRGGAAGYSAEPFTWTAFSSGSFAVGALFAIAFFLGVESTAVYREEVRDPDRTIPRATFIVIGTIAVGYALTAYSLIIALGTKNAVSTSAEDPTGAFGSAATAMIGNMFAEFVAILVITSVLASMLAMSNALARYLYCFGVDQVLPKSLGAVHPRHGSPHRAAVTTVVLTGALLFAVALGGSAPEVSYGVLSGVSVFGFEVLILLMSLSAIVYFRRHRGTGESVWSRILAPGATVAIFSWLMYYSAARSELLLGTPIALTRVLLVLLGGGLLAGFALASWFAAHRPGTYERIGRTLE